MDMNQIVIVAPRMDREDGKRSMVWIPIQNVNMMESEEDCTYVEFKMPNGRGGGTAIRVSPLLEELTAEIARQLNDEDQEPEPGTFAQGTPGKEGLTGVPSPE